MLQRDGTAVSLRFNDPAAAQAPPMRAWYPLGNAGAGPAPAGARTGADLLRARARRCRDPTAVASRPACPAWLQADLGRAQPVDSWGDVSLISITVNPPSGLSPSRPVGEKGGLMIFSRP